MEMPVPEADADVDGDGYGNLVTSEDNPWKLDTTGAPHLAEMTSSLDNGNTDQNKRAVLVLAGLITIAILSFGKLVRFFFRFFECGSP